MQCMHKGQTAKCGTSKDQNGPNSTGYCIIVETLYWLDGTHTLRNDMVGGALDRIYNNSTEMPIKSVNL